MRLKSGEHVNFFSDLETGKTCVTKQNPQYAKEKSEKQEIFEKQIGFLTYLGQDSKESLGQRDWYVIPKTKKAVYEYSTKVVETELKNKIFNDPLNVMRALSDESSSKIFTNDSMMSNKRNAHDLEAALIKNKKKLQETKEKQSKHKYSSDQIKTCLPGSEKNAKLKRLRAERLKREQIEKYRSDNLLNTFKGNQEPIIEIPEQSHTRLQSPRRLKQKYNSQFNPFIAKQNYENLRK